MVVHQFRFDAAEAGDELLKGHAMQQPHPLHRLRDLLDFDQLVVVCRHQPIEGVANEAEAEVAVAQLPGLFRCDESGFAMGVLSPEAVG